jgi:hypothetical protein
LLAQWGRSITLNFFHFEINVFFRFISILF